MNPSQTKTHSASVLLFVQCVLCLFLFAFFEISDCTEFGEVWVNDDDSTFSCLSKGQTLFCVDFCHIAMSNLQIKET